MPICNVDGGLLRVESAHNETVLYSITLHDLDVIFNKENTFVYK
jgi:hypothetical protein